VAAHHRQRYFFFSSLSLSSRALSDTQVHEPCIQALPHLMKKGTYPVLQPCPTGKGI
jgi:hypothetical protein